MKINFVRSTILAMLVAVLLVTGCAPGQLVSNAVGGPENLEAAQAIAQQGWPLDQQVKASLVDGNVVNVTAIGLMRTIQGVLDVYREAEGSYILESPSGDFLLSWAMGAKNYGMLALDKFGRSFNILNIVSGKCTCYEINDVTKYLVGQGWRQAYPEDLPIWLTSALGSAQAFVTGYGTFLVQFPLIVIIPGGMFNDPYATYPN